MAKKKTAQQQQYVVGASAAAQLFLEMQSKSAQWYEKERAGIALLEGFQTALNACRDELSTTTTATPDGGDDDSSSNSKGAAGKESFSVATALSGLGGNAQMDPLLAEDLFAQVKALRCDFDTLLQEIYALHAQARSAVLAASVSSSVAPATSATALAPIDYYQFMSHELAAYEAEFQHVEALLEMISFDVTTDELRTLVISWSTSPFLNPEQSRAFRKRHDLAAAV